MQKDIALEKGVFMVTFDTELAWGTQGDARYAADYSRTRDVIARTLGALERHDLSATWAVVGHLFLESCGPWHDTKHPEIARTGEWFVPDPGTDVRRDPLWYGPDIIRAIRACPVKQEIGSHSFSHIVSEPFCDEACLESELKECRRLADREGIRLDSFVFPRNAVKHVPVLARNGFRIYRGRDNVWYDGLPRPLRKLAHGIDAYLWPYSPVGLPERHDGIMSVPGNQFYVHRSGWARSLPVSFRVRKAMNGLKRATRERRVFHLWCHPFNLASDPDGLVGGLENIFAAAAGMQRDGRLDNLTMGRLAERYA